MAITTVPQAFPPEHSSRELLQWKTKQNKPTVKTEVTYSLNEYIWFLQKFLLSPNSLHFFLKTEKRRLLKITYDYTLASSNCNFSSNDWSSQLCLCHIQTEDSFFESSQLKLSLINHHICSHTGLLLSNFCLCKPQCLVSSELWLQPFRNGKALWGVCGPRWILERSWRSGGKTTDQNSQEVLTQPLSKLALSNCYFTCG